jgi:hypothetical protein
MTHDPLVDRLLASAGFLNSLLIAATAAAGAIVLIKLVAKKDPVTPEVVEVFGVDIPIGRAWIVFAIFTVGHIYASYVFRQDCSEIIKKSPDLQIDAWQSLTGASLLFFHGLIARLQVVHIQGHPVFVMDETDPTTWLVHAVALLVFIAIIRIRNASLRTRIGTASAGIVIVILNWLVGGGWAIAASLLAESSKGN